MSSTSTEPTPPPSPPKVNVSPSQIVQTSVPLTDLPLYQFLTAQTGNIVVLTNESDTDIRTIAGALFSATSPPTISTLEGLISSGKTVVIYYNINGSTAYYLNYTGGSSNVNMNKSGPMNISTLVPTQLQSDFAKLINTDNGCAAWTELSTFLSGSATLNWGCNSRELWQEWWFWLIVGAAAVLVVGIAVIAHQAANRRRESQAIARASNSAPQ